MIVEGQDNMISEEKGEVGMRRKRQFFSFFLDKLQQNTSKAFFFGRDLERIGRHATA